MGRSIRARAEGAAVNHTASYFGDDGQKQAMLSISVLCVRQVASFQWWVLRVLG